MSGLWLWKVIEAVVIPDMPQNQDFVRVKIKFDVSRPLRQSKVVNLPGGKSTVVTFHYERIQKRCYNCQRLTHEKDLCPLLIKQRLDQTIDRKLGKKFEKPKPSLVLKESDPLFGVLSEDQVGMHPVLGRPRIAPDVLEGMRQYLLMGDGEDRKIREARVKSSVAETEKDPFLQKTVLRMEPPPLISNDISKGRGVVFGYDSSDSSSNSAHYSQLVEKSSLAVVENRNEDVIIPWGSNAGLVDSSIQMRLFSIPIQSGSTVFRTGLSEAGSSGTRLNKLNPRKRPTKNQRKLKCAVVGGESAEVVKNPGLEEGVITKRKAGKGIMVQAKAAKFSKNEVVPNEGLSHI